MDRYVQKENGPAAWIMSETGIIFVIAYTDFTISFLRSCNVSERMLAVWLLGCSACCNYHDVDDATTIDNAHILLIVSLYVLLCISIRDVLC